MNDDKAERVLNYLRNRSQGHQGSFSYGAGFDYPADLAPGFIRSTYAKEFKAAIEKPSQTISRDEEVRAFWASAEQQPAAQPPAAQPDAAQPDAQTDEYYPPHWLPNHPGIITD